MAVVQSQMMFLEPWAGNQESPYIRGLTTEEYPRQNFSNLEYAVKFHSARPEKDNFKLDTHGFEFHSDAGIDEELVSAIQRKDKPFIAEKYYPVVEDIVKSKTGAQRVIIFDHTYRRRDPSLDPNVNKDGNEQPATLAHVDQSEIGAIGRVKRHAGEDAEKLLRGRVQVLNVWRPTNGTVEDWPLACMDYRSVQHTDIHPTNIFKERYERVGQTVSINYNTGQIWYYLPDHRTDEVTIIKIWDSKEDVAKLCPHGAFPYPHANKGAKPRESLEVRCLVFYDE
ncbi:methyltransferase [Xylaria bambusicola]|uniref:methyltransferase n=1 Tax=Xylaria bambusicola TaxID=326684 RepID=UPI0020076F36|nr:methyltransferase [Xylaria bambusicola]KAI0517008.1 methyltransferase [Xylaria bambusicola]